MNRNQLERELRRLITGCQGCNDDSCVYCLVCLDDEITKAMNLVDTYVDTVLTSLSDQELWPASKVAEYRGLSSEHGARASMSRHKVRAVKTIIDPRTGRRIVLYSADEVRALPPARKASRR